VTDPRPSAAHPASPRPGRATLALRGLVGGFALSAAVIAGAGHLAAATSSHDSNAPVDFAADHMEVQDKQKRVVLTGNVDITQVELRLTADRTLMAYTDTDKLTLQRVDATGHVVVTRNDQRASGDVAVYDLNKRLITMVGHVVLNRANGDTLNGGRLVIDLDTGISNLDGHTASGPAPAAGGAIDTHAGRVSGTFNVPKKDDKTDTKAPAPTKPAHP
jgi:lipopolysaccharide export system protein LptA